MAAVKSDTGLGTTYERVAVARMLESLGARYDIRNVLEGPTDGITGIRGLNSVPLAQAGARVDLVLGDADEAELARRAWDTLGLGELLTVRAGDGRGLGAVPRSYDLVWNFNSLPQVDDPEGLVRAMCEASRDLVLVFTSNTWNYGFPLHRLHHRAAKEEWSHGNIAMMNTRKIEGALADGGFGVVERLLVDVPWWPDIDSPIEEVAATFLPFLGGLKSGSKRLQRYTWTIETLPYFDAAKRSSLERELGRHFLIEDSRFFPLKLFFAHHRGVLARRRDAE
ncbi:MAG: class I SAM-dependent methyltransferase [Candidatus Eisenbacteria bacterium]